MQLCPYIVVVQLEDTVRVFEVTLFVWESGVPKAMSIAVCEGIWCIIIICYIQDSLSVGVSAITRRECSAIG